jgi:molybdopterin-guanine dinucleotide biosynthesis protein A
VSAQPASPLGAILAGGLGRRMGGGKALVELAGRPLISYPLAAMRAALEEVVVIAKPGSELPELEGVSVWREPPEPRHPVVGIRAALSLAGGRPVVVCAGDMPFVDAMLLHELAAADPGGAAAVVAAHDGELEPLLGSYRPAAAAGLAGADRPLREIVAGIGPRLFEVADARTLFNVNTREDLAAAEAILAGR